MSNTTAPSSPKRAAVLEAAKVSFLRVGFAATNLDEVAAAAGVSKMTIYSHFGSKDNLFIGVLESVIAQHSADAPPLDADLDEPRLGEALTAIAINLVATVQHPEVIGLRRALIGEQPRHPLLAARWRRSTVLATVDELTAFFDVLGRRGLLSIDDPHSLATQFLWMLIGDALDAGLLDPGEKRPPIRAQAKGVVDIVLAAYTRRE